MATSKNPVQETTGRRIIAYGHPVDRPSDQQGFDGTEHLRRFIAHDIYAVQGGRYHYTQSRPADIIVLTYKGIACGHFNISGTEPPNDEDRHHLEDVKCTYLVESSAVYRKPFKLSEAGVDTTKMQFGIKVEEEQFANVLRLAFGFDEYPR